MLVTSALPYANGDIHIGHMLEYLQTDIWVRFQRLRGQQCLYVCADDAHGTPIMLRARQQGIEAAELIATYQREHQADFRDFCLSFDHYHSTHSEENRLLLEQIYGRLQSSGHIVRRAIFQAYDAKAGMFLPDRFIRGGCPRCKAADQYGDSCEQCGATYRPTELSDARSVLTDSAPQQRQSEHYFFRLKGFAQSLQAWSASGALQPEIQNKIAEWFNSGLRDWDISRDAPYWGFEIPDAPGKYFYVWMDAPIGYMASFQAYCQANGECFDDFWQPGSDTELYHFIGKDIAYFHTLFWPAMLMGSGFRLPTGVFCHGFLTVAGQKMAKSRGAFLSARRYLDMLSPDYLRYYYASRLGPGIEDLDLNPDDFMQRNNSDLVGKLINIAARCAGLLERHGGGRLSSTMVAESVWDQTLAAAEEIAAAYEGRDFNRAMRRIMELANVTNQYLNAEQPWTLADKPEQSARLRDICSAGLNLFRVLMGYLQPVIPLTAAAAADYFSSPLPDWREPPQPLRDLDLPPYKPLLQRIRKEQITALWGRSDENVELPRQPSAATKKEAAVSAAVPPPAAEFVDKALLDRIDLRVGRITRAEEVADSRALLLLEVDLGAGQKRSVFAALKGIYQPLELLDRLVVVVANMKPRKMRFGRSEGMLLAAVEEGGTGVFLLSPDSGAEAGQRLR